MDTSQIHLLSEDECQDLEAFLVERIYEFNAHATGYFDGRLIGGCIRSETAEVIAAFNGNTWGGCCVVSHLWVHQSHRGRGLGRAVLEAVEAEAARRHCAQVVLTTHSFQAPRFYERLGYEKRAVIAGQPRGYANIVYVKRLGDQVEYDLSPTAPPA